MTKFIKRGNMGARMTEICKKKKKKKENGSYNEQIEYKGRKWEGS